MEGIGGYASLKARVKELKDAQREMEEREAERAAQDGGLTLALRELNGDKEKEVATGKGRVNPRVTPKTVQELFALQRAKYDELEGRNSGLERRLADAVARLGRLREGHEKEKATWEKKLGAHERKAEMKEKVAIEELHAEREKHATILKKERDSADSKAREAERRLTKDRELAEARLEAENENLCIELHEVKSKLVRTTEEMRRQGDELQALLQEARTATNALHQEKSQIEKVLSIRSSENETALTQLRKVTLAATKARQQHADAIARLESARAEEVAEIRDAHNTELEEVHERFKTIMASKNSEIEGLRRELLDARKSIREAENLLL